MGKFHERYGTPYIGTILTGLMIVAVTGLVPIETIANVNLDIRQTFKVPYLPAIGSPGIVFNVGTMLSLQWRTWLRLAIWLALGLAVYFF